MTSRAMAFNYRLHQMLAAVLLGICLPRAGFAAPQKRWTQADFGGVLSVGLEGHRNFLQGRTLFLDYCAKCHKIGVLGGGDAADLTRRALTYTPEELLDHLLEPKAHPAKSSGSLDHLSQAQVLDLLAFVLSGADAKSSFFFTP